MAARLMTADRLLTLPVSPDFPADTPLADIRPAAFKDAAAAIGFAVAWALAQAAGPEKTLFWIAPEAIEIEWGGVCAQGLSQFGADLARLIVVRARDQSDALWAAEQALSVPQTIVLCSIAPASRALTLTAARRLFLLSEKHQSRCLLLRFDPPGVSAASMCFSVTAAPCSGSGRELGAPVFDVTLTRQRAGPGGRRWRLLWSAHEHAFTSLPAPDGDLVRPSVERSVDEPSSDPQRRRIA